MKKTTVALLILTLACTMGMAQKHPLTLNDVVRGGSHYATINQRDFNQLQWLDDKHYSYVADDTLLIIKDLNGKICRTLSTQTIATIYQDTTPDRFPSHHWRDAHTLAITKQGTSYFYTVASGNITQVNYPKEAENIDIAYPNQHLAYTIDNNLYIATIDTPSISITAYADKDIVCGQTVHRNEFGISKGTFWSPDGQHLAYYIKDESQIHNYPLVDITARAGQAHFIKYPMAGMPSEVVKIAIYNLQDNKSIEIKTQGAPDHYLTNLSWAPNNRQLYVAEINRGQDSMQLNCYSAETGDFIRTLFTENNPAYVEPQTPLVFLPDNESLFLWQSRRDGYNHLYLYNTQGELLKQIGKGPWEVTEMLGFDAKLRQVIVSSTEPSPIERHLYALGLYDDSKVCYTQDPGYHRAQLSPNGSFLLDRWSALDEPEHIDLIKLRNSKRTTLVESTKAYQDYALGSTQLVHLKAADDSTMLFGRLILPPHFDQTKKYPTIIYVYGGPHSQLINNTTYGNVQMWQHYMAQKGYVMFTLDNRGTSYRGAAFEQVIHRQLGKHEMADQMKGYDYLCGLNYVDTARMGVFGWSFGGFMTTSLMTHYPKAFKAGVAGGPVIDWSNYEVMYGERYMDTPQENPEGYEAANLCNDAPQLEGRLLMIHGGQDPVVLWQHSQKFVRQCVEDGVQLDYFIYPTHEHNVRGKDRVHLMQKITQHFDDHL